MSLLLGAVLLPATTATPAAAGEGMETLCDQAGYGCVDGTGYRGQSVWGANYFRTGHNCTSYVSFVLARAGATQPWRPMGDGARWDDNGAGAVPVDDTPTVGAVAQWDGGSRLAPGSGGHVAIVDVVTPDFIEISDDTNAGRTRRLRIHHGSPYWPDSFVHIWDRPTVAELHAGLTAGVVALIDAGALLPPARGWMRGLRSALSGPA